MTWQHLQQLRATAQSSIQQHLAQAQPVGGQGAIVQGGSIALLPDRRAPGESRTAPWTLVIYATIEYEWSGVDADGKNYSHGGSYPTAAAAWVPRGAAFRPFLNSYLLQLSQFFELSPDEETGAYSKRTSTVKFEARALPGAYGPYGFYGYDRPYPYDHGEYWYDYYGYKHSYYRIPVEITVGHEVTTAGKPPEIVKSRRLILRRNGATYTAKPDQVDEFYQLRVLDVKRI